MKFRSLFGRRPVVAAHIHLIDGLCSVQLGGTMSAPHPLGVAPKLWDRLTREDFSIVALRTVLLGGPSHRYLSTLNL